MTNRAVASVDVEDARNRLAASAVESGRPHPIPVHVVAVARSSLHICCGDMAGDVSQVNSVVGDIDSTIGLFVLLYSSIIVLSQHYHNTITVL